MAALSCKILVAAFKIRYATKLRYNFFSVIYINLYKNYKYYKINKMHTKINKFVNFIKMSIELQKS